MHSPRNAGIFSHKSIGSPISYKKKIGQPIDTNDRLPDNKTHQQTTGAEMDEVKKALRELRAVWPKRARIEFWETKTDGFHIAMKRPNRSIRQVGVLWI